MSNYSKPIKTLVGILFAYSSGAFAEACDRLDKAEAELATEYLSTGTTYYRCENCTFTFKKRPKLRVAKSVAIAESSDRRWSLKLEGQVTNIGTVFVRIENHGFRRLSHLVGCDVSASVEEPGPMELVAEISFRQNLGKSCDETQLLLRRLDPTGHRVSVPASFIWAERSYAVVSDYEDITTWSGFDPAVDITFKRMVLDPEQAAAEAKLKTPDAGTSTAVGFGPCQSEYEPEKKMCAVKHVTLPVAGQPGALDVMALKVTVPKGKEKECSAMAKRVLDSFNPKE